MRYRITIRGTDIELRGYVDGDVNIRLVAQAMEGLAIVVGSPAEDDFDPFTKDGIPIELIWEMQATVIRRERARADAAEKELRDRR